MKIWICKTCDYIYDEREGDTESGIRPWVKYEDLPSNWACPACGNTKKEFVSIESNSDMDYIDDKTKVDKKIHETVFA